MAGKLKNSNIEQFDLSKIPFIVLFVCFIALNIRILGFFFGYNLENMKIDI